jgi:DNA-binding MarR family transcriptional regulator
MNAATSTSNPEAADKVPSAPARSEIAAALDIRDYVSGPAGEAWALVVRLFFREGKPRFPTIAAELDLHPSQAIVLRLLSEPRSMGELAQAMHCDNSNITGIVDRLEERGLVRREAAEGDRRVKLLVLTEDGERVRVEITKRMAEPPPPIASLSEADQQALRDILKRAVEGISDGEIADALAGKVEAGSQ